MFCDEPDRATAATDGRQEAGFQAHPRVAIAAPQRHPNPRERFPSQKHTALKTYTFYGILPFRIGM